MIDDRAMGPPELCRVVVTAFGAAIAGCTPGEAEWPGVESAPAETAAAVPTAERSLRRERTNTDDATKECNLALALNGAGGYLAAPVPTADPFAVEATLSAWVYFDELPSTAGRMFHIVGKSGFARDLDLLAEPDNRFHFYVAIGRPNTVMSTSAVALRAWHQVVATYRAGDRIALYVDGVLEAQRPIPGVARVGNEGPITIGESLTFNGRYFHGFIDEVGLWSRVLSVHEIADGAPLGDCTDPTLVAGYAFDGGARDCSSHALHGQLFGGATLVPLGRQSDCARLGR